MFRTAVVSCMVLGAAAVAATQDPVSSGPTQPLKSGVQAVVIDAVVRDGRGHPVTDLRKEDFQLFEDGVEQHIGDVSVIGTPAGRGAEGGRSPADAAADAPGQSATGARRTVPTAPAGADFLAIVFDRLGPDARALAYKGALAAVETLRDGDFVGVFLSNLSLETIQPYTNDRDRIKEAIREVASRATAAFDRAAIRDRERDEFGNIRSGDAHPSVPDVASPDSEGRPVDGRTNIPRLSASLELATRVTWETMSRDHQGYATTDALLAVTSALGLLPGRKTVVFFAEALAIPEAVLPHFRNVVATANRANVSIYTVDGAGLRVHSQDATTAREVTAMGLRGAATNYAGDGGGGAMTWMLERNEDVLRKDPRTSLTLLAQQTGGFLIENTNDLASGFRRIDDDRRFHYLLTYTPRNTEPDGRWRAITVKIPNRNVTVRARSGYFATGGASTLPVLAYEAPGLAALQRSPAPADLPLRARALVFPGESGSRVAVLAATDASSLRFERDDRGQQYRTDFSIVARIVDDGGSVVRKSSEPYRLTGPLQQVDQAQRGAVLFFRQPQLKPGRYTLEAAVHDALSGKSGVRRTAFEVPDVRVDGLQVSSLVLIARAEKAAPPPGQQDNPLYVGEALIYPNLGEPISRRNQVALTFLVTIAGARGGIPMGVMEVRRGEQKLAGGPITLPPPNAAGRIDHLLQIPVDALPAGTYMVRLTVTQGDRRESRDAVFELRD